MITTAVSESQAQGAFDISTCAVTFTKRTRTVTLALLALLVSQLPSQGTEPPMGTGDGDSDDPRSDSDSSESPAKPKLNRGWRWGRTPIPGKSGMAVGMDPPGRL
jgi:hypothetical protein